MPDKLNQSETQGAVEVGATIHKLAGDNEHQDVHAMRETLEYAQQLGVIGDATRKEVALGKTDPEVLKIKGEVE